MAWGSNMLSTLQPSLMQNAGLVPSDMNIADDIRCASTAQSACCVLYSGVPQVSAMLFVADPAYPQEELLHCRG